MTVSIQELSARGPLFEGAIRVYGAAFAQPPYSDPDRGADVRQRMMEQEKRRAGYRALVALDDDAAGAVDAVGVPVGMAYGYRGEAGQWWHDTVANAISMDQRQRWLGHSYELVEIAVQPGRQGEGIGAALIEALLVGQPDETCVLSTRSDSRAQHLYRRLGFEDIIEMRFSEFGAPFLIMGRQLPLPAHRRRRAAPVDAG